MIILTEAVIGKRLREAIFVRAAMQPTGPRMRDVEQTEGVLSIQHLAETLSWLDWLGSDDADLVQARLEGARWKTLCFRFGISRPTAYRRWRHALSLIAWRLNGHELPANCSRRRLMQLAAPQCETLSLGTPLPDATIAPGDSRAGTR